MQNKTDKGTLLVSKSLPIVNSSSVNHLFSARKMKYYDSLCAMELTGENEGAHDLLLETVVRAFVERDKITADCEQGEWMKQRMLRIYDERTAHNRK